MTLRAAYLGPAGTFSEDALRAATAGVEVEACRPRPCTTRSCRWRAARSTGRWCRSRTRSTARCARPSTRSRSRRGVTIAGEHDQPIRHALIARTELALGAIEAVVSHPQPSAQCAGSCARSCPEPSRIAESTAEAVRTVGASERPWALWRRRPPEIYGCVVLRDGVEDEHGNVTRFVWIAPDGVRAEGNGDWRTTLIFSELGADHPGALVEALTEFSDRQVNLVRIESRPPARPWPLHVLHRPRRRRHRPGRRRGDRGALRDKAENVRVLGSYPISPDRLPDPQSTSVATRANLLSRQSRSLESLAP